MPYRGDAVSINWVATDDELRDAVGEWGRAIGFDTEFIRTNTFYPVAGLYQVASGEQVYLLDPLELTDWSPFVDYLENPATVVVMHACQEDLELLHHHIGGKVEGLFDTQFANAYASEDFSLSYAALVDRLLSVELAKHETRSNWLRRPLSDEQIRYAAEDVVYLVPMYEKLAQVLGELERRPWFDADMNERAVYEVPAPELYYRNIKRAWQLSGTELSVLRELASWRETTARRLDIPRNRVVWDEHLFSFAKLERLTESRLVEMLPRSVASRHGADLIQRHREGLSGDAPETPSRPLTSAQGAVLKELRDIARQKADDIGIARELLARKRDLEACVRSFVTTGYLSDQYNGWRAHLVASEFERILAGLRS